MNYTDAQLKQALAKMLPEVLCFHNGAYEDFLQWHSDKRVLDTELLHLCRVVEQALDFGMNTGSDGYRYAGHLYNSVVPQNEQPFRASWQQRVIALAQVKGVEIL